MCNIEKNPSQITCRNDCVVHVKGLVSVSLVPAHLIDCTRWTPKKKKRSQARQPRARGEDGGCDKEQRRETEDSYVLWMRSSGWLWGRSLTPPSAPHATPVSLTSSPLQMMHNGFLCFNGPGAHTGVTATNSHRSMHTSAICQTDSVALLSYLNVQSC